MSSITILLLALTSAFPSSDVARNGAASFGTKKFRTKFPTGQKTDGLEAFIFNELILLKNRRNC